MFEQGFLKRGECLLVQRAWRGMFQSYPFCESKSERASLYNGFPSARGEQHIVDQTAADHIVPRQESKTENHVAQLPDITTPLVRRKSFKCFIAECV